MKPYSIIIIILLDFITKNFANNRIRVFLAWPFHNHLCTAIFLLSNQLCYFLLMYVIVALLIDIIVLVYNYPALWVLSTSTTLLFTIVFMFFRPTAQGNPILWNWCSFMFTIWKYYNFGSGELHGKMLLVM